ncbi:MAG: glycosyltransferase family 39 protein, partial [Gemmatimonadota bacterium]
MAPAEERRTLHLTTAQMAWAVLAGLVAAHVILAILQFDPKPFVGGDNAGYMILAESIETGQGYRNIHLPGAPRHAHYPPFYPALLVVAKLFGGGLIAFKVMSLIFTSISLVFFFVLARARLGWEAGLAVAAPFALNPVLVYYSHWVLSEAPFVLLTLAALWASERMTESWRWFALALACGILAYLTRAAGLPALAALSQ